MAPLPDEPDETDEALLHLRWARGAGGRFVFGTSETSEPEIREIPGTSEVSEVSGVGEVLDAEGSAAPRLGRSAPEPAGAPGPVESPESFESSESELSEVPGGVEETLARLSAQASACRRCGLCDSRATAVFGEGSPRPRLLFVGEAPGADEDRTGRPFVGRAGQLLTKMIEAIGLDRADVYIANVLKCRPPDNRPPRPDEVAACLPFLEEQVRVLRPDLVVSLGNHATRALLRTDRGIGALRGRVQTSPAGWRVLPTFHPAYLLRTPEAKREAWQDLQLAAATVGLPLPRRAPSATPEPSPAPAAAPA